MMRRRQALGLIMLLPAAAAGQGRDKLRGTLERTPSGQPALKTREGRLVELSGDEATLAVLADERLRGADLEAVGKLEKGRFEVNPIHLRALFVYRKGQRLLVTYWCPICSIRTYSPGNCVCCQQDTELDLRDPALKDTDPAPPHL
jgi:hypothetical protein